MGEYFADGSTVELSKEQLDRYRTNDPLYTLQKAQQLEQTLDNIIQICEPLSESKLEYVKELACLILYIANKED